MDIPCNAHSCNTCVRWKNRGFIKSYKKKFLIMKIISNEMCSMQIVGVCGTFCMETDKILIPKHLHCLGF